MLRIVTGEAWTRDRTAETLSMIECQSLPAEASSAGIEVSVAREADVGSVDHKSVQEV